MAYDPATGMWAAEDDSVQKQLNGLLSKSNPLMEQAKTQGMQYANKRGMLNSSIGAQASQQALYSAAVPIASQDASQIAQKNLATQQYVQNKDIQAEQLQSSERVAAMNVAAHDRQYAVSAVAELEKKYGAMWTEVLKNNDLSKAARDAYYEHISVLRDQDMNLVEQLYGIDLDWASATATHSLA